MTEEEVAKLDDEPSPLVSNCMTEWQGCAYRVSDYGRGIPSEFLTIW